MLFKPFPLFIKHIAVIAPSGPCSTEALKNCCKLINSFGIKVTIMGGSSKSSFSYLSTTLDDRLNDLHACWKDDSIDLIIAARGGFGAAHLLPQINWSLLSSKDIPLIGFSDITALHLAMITKGIGSPIAGWHFGRFNELLEDKHSSNAFKDAISGSNVDLSNFKNRKLTFIKGETIEHPVIPVNLSVLVTLLGTEYMPDFSGKVLLVEDLNEPLYKVDRYFTQLEQCGILRQCGALIFGQFTNCGNLRERNILFEKVAEKISGPVAKGFPFGHKLPMCALRYNSLLHC